MKKLLTTIMFTLWILGHANAQKGTFQVMLSNDIRFDQYTNYSSGKLRATLVGLLNKSHVISLGSHAESLVIVPYMTTITKDVTPTVPPMISYQLELNLSLINLYDNTVFHSDFFELKGIGKTENKAYSNAFNRLRYAQKRVDAFLEDAKKKVIDYYEVNCNRIANEALRDAELDRYTEAFSRLASVPTFVHCQAEISKHMIELYEKKKNRDCGIYLSIARSAFVLKDYRAVTTTLNNIFPSSSCYEEAEKLKERIKVEVDEFLEKKWERDDKLIDKATEITKAKYEAVEFMGAAALVDSQHRNTHDSYNNNNRLGGGSDVVVNNNNITNVNSQGDTQKKGITDAEPVKKKNTPQTLFRVVSPASRSSTGEVFAYQDSLKIYGYIDHPKKAKKLIVDGKETRWDNDGVFSRTIFIREPEREVPLLLETVNNQKLAKTLLVKKSTNKPQKAKPTALPKDLKKSALIIGNNGYIHVDELRNARNDALDMAATLSSFGFDVSKVLDADRNTMRDAVDNFGAKIAESDVVLFYYSGHGIEVDRKNYLVPVDAKIQSPNDIRKQTLALESVLTAMETINENSLHIIILDACRNNTFPKGSRGGGGLARVTPPTGTIIAYSTEPGSVASDGEGENGLYTGELIRQMKIPQRIHDVFRNTRNEVEHKSNGNQKPWEEERLKGVFYFVYDE
ncbi:caspase family protein [Fulvivirga sp. M361]|uniref:caspase family protein n=1 Tax=Fulvivirga sp. M361 TaxID=2594266 RepID=UPI001628E287|nr:caspase family protein [Fulvivirga sp. M361]